MPLLIFFYFYVACLYAIDAYFEMRARLALYIDATPPDTSRYAFLRVIMIDAH